MISINKVYKPRMNFSKKVYDLVKKIPKGKVATYKDIAEALHTKAYRAVGQALKRNKGPDKIPCYRVIKSDGSVGGYSGSDPKNIRKKIKKLEADGIKIADGKVVGEYFYIFN